MLPKRSKFGTVMTALSLTAFRCLCSDFAKMSALATLSGALRYGADLLLVRIRQSDRVRRIQLLDGTRLSYRLNRGDMQSIREVWLDEAYELPFKPASGVLIDLGANIGLTSLWLAKRYCYHKII